ncbi:MAG: 6-phosphofructokinase [Acidiferrobacterales bacterium]|nr:6-phosphofructokinase [Acidiferrobacterales bacterium]
MSISGNLLYAQSGGVTSVINVSAAAVIETSRAHPDAIGRVFAAKDGILGVLNETLIDVTEEPEGNLRALKHTPSGAFGSCRYKLQDPERQHREFDRVVDVFEQYNIRHFLYNGGNDSADTCLKLARQLEKRLGDVTVNHIPKTVDNDLAVTDCCPGFGSVAKYIAISTREASFDVAAMASTSTKVFIIEVMGRHAGWIAAAGGLASDSETNIPIVILFPEVPFDRASFTHKVKHCVQTHGYVSIVVSEGARYEDGRFLAEQGTRDAFGHAQLGGAAQVVAQIVRDDLGFKYHYAVADYLQRSARHIASKTDFDQAYAVGKAAVEYAASGKSGLMPAIRRLSDAPYRWDIVEADLADIANTEKMLPRDFISDDGFGITQSARDYLSPLIAGESYPPYSNGLPEYVRLRNIPIAPKLPADWSTHKN